MEEKRVWSLEKIQPSSVWDDFYKSQKDTWSNTAVYNEFLKYYDNITQGKSKLSILIPMCGRSRLLLQLAEKGHNVVGIEWSKTAVELFFKDNLLTWKVTSCFIGDHNTHVYKANGMNITIYCGDFFSFKGHDLGLFDCIIEYGGISCFGAKDKRSEYVHILSSLLKSEGRCLFSAFDYDFNEYPTVPFAVAHEEIIEHFGTSFDCIVLQELDKRATAEIFTGKIVPIRSFTRYSWTIYLLTKK